METTVSQAGTAPAAEGGARLRGPVVGAIIAALLLTVLLEALDQTVVGTAMPKIIATLQGFDRYTWVVTAYSLATTVATPIAGKLSDQFGRKWFLLGGSAIFLIGSLFAGASQTMEQLIAFRAVQGMGAGIGIALAMTVVADLFPPAERAKWQGIVASAYAVSNLIGPFVGGWLADHGPLVGTFVENETRWRWAFYLNVPVALVAIGILFVLLPGRLNQPEGALRGRAAIARIDFLGAVLASLATISLLLGLTWGGNQTYAWNSPQVIGILAAALVLFVAFFIVERFAAEPLLPLGLFRNRVFAADSALTVATGMAMVPLFIYLPLFLQGVLGVSATNAGLLTTPTSLASVIGAFLIIALISNFKRYQVFVIGGMAIFVVGTFLISRMTATTTQTQAIVFMVIAGLGLGSYFGVGNLIAQNAVPASQLGVATSAIRYLQSLGSTIGIAAVGTVVNNSLSSTLATSIPASTAQTLTPAGLAAATNPQVLVSPEYHDSVVRTAVQYATQNVPPGPQHDAIVTQVTALLDQVFAAVRDALAVALQHGFVVALAFTVLALVAAFFLKDMQLANYKPTEKTPDTETDAATATAR